MKNEFFFEKSLQALKVFYGSMKTSGFSIGVFNYEFNGVISIVLFDSRGDEWRLVFVKKGIGDVLVIPVRPGYRFCIDGNEQYFKFRRYFMIGCGKGQFSIGDFIKEFEGKIPVKMVIADINDDARRSILKYDTIDNESDGIYPIGFKSWENYHILHPEIPADKYHCSEKNKEKTRALYPQIYAVIKNLDISVLYSEEKGINTYEIIKSPLKHINKN